MKLLKSLIAPLAFTLFFGATVPAVSANKKAVANDELEAVYLCVDSTGRRELVDTNIGGLCKRIDLPGQAKALPWGKGKPPVRRPTASQESAAKAIALRRLRDPDSAKFRDLISSKDSKYVCGYLNAKNRMGGYEGFQPFVVGLTAKSFRTSGEAGFMDDCH